MLPACTNNRCFKALRLPFISSVPRSSVAPAGLWQPVKSLRASTQNSLCFQKSLLILFFTNFRVDFHVLCSQKLFLCLLQRIKPRSVRFQLLGKDQCHGQAKSIAWYTWMFSKKKNDSCSSSYTIKAVEVSMSRDRNQNILRSLQVWCAPTDPLRSKGCKLLQVSGASVSPVHIAPWTLEAFPSVVPHAGAPQDFKPQKPLRTKYVPMNDSIWFNSIYSKF